MKTCAQQRNKYMVVQSIHQLGELNFTVAYLCSLIIHYSFIQVINELLLSR